MTFNRECSLYRHLVESMIRIKAQPGRVEYKSERERSANLVVYLVVYLVV